MRKFIIITAAAAALALAAPTAALAGDFTGVSTNGTTKDAIGFCVQNGNTVYHQWGTTTGADRSSRAGQPGANAALIQDDRAACAGWEAPSAPPAQP
jgi:hypothetical protein